MESCEFCNEFTRGYLDIGGIKNRILYETDNFMVFPALGQIVEGYLLIVPKEHYLNMGSLPIEMYSELESIKEKVQNILQEVYEMPVIFEHGPVSSTRRGGCCIDHAHFHVVPVNVDIIQELSRSFSYRTITSLIELKQQFESGTPYFFVEDQQKNKYVFDIIRRVPSQYIRKIIASKIGKLEIYDWGAYFGIEEMKRTIKKLKRLF